MRPDCRKRVGKILGRPMMAEEERAIDRRMRRAVKQLKRTEPGWKDMTKMQRLDKAAALAGDSFAAEMEEFRMEVPAKTAPPSEDVRAAERARQERADQMFPIKAVRGVRFVRRQGNPEDTELTGGRWFTDRPETANTYSGKPGGDMATASMKVRLRLRNPLVVDAQGKRFDGIPREWLPEDVQKQAIRGKLLSTDDIADAARLAEGNYDGIIFKNLKDDLTSNAITTKPATVYAVFDRKNIRSEFAQFDPEFSEMPGLLFQSAADNQNNLFVAHNTSEGKLRKTLELGGMPMPSLAVARTDKGGFAGYGEITFLADPRILNEKDVTAHDADIYSPRVPQALPEYDEAEAAKFIKESKPSIPEDAGILPYLSLDEMTSDLPYELSHSDFVRAAYLAEQSRLPKLKKLKVPPAVRKAMDLEWMSDEWKALATEHFRKMEDEFNAARVEAGRQPINVHFEDDGTLSRRSANEFDNLIRKARKSQYDQEAFQREVYKRTAGTQAARDKFRKYTTALATRITKGKRMFAGFSYSGNRRFKAFNLENIMQEMRKEMREGQRDAFGGEGSIRARVATAPMRTMRDVQKARNRIVSSEELEQIKEENSNRFFELTEQLQPFYKFSASGMEYMDAVADAIADGPRGWRESFDADAVPLIQEYVDHLRSLPTEYFEAKANRIMRVNDFAVAVVPRNISPDVKKALQDAGVQLRFYKKGDEADRLRAIRQQDGLLFQRGDPKGWGETTPPPDLPPMRLNLAYTRDAYGDDAVKRLPAPIRERAASGSSVDSMMDVVRAVKKTLKRKPPKTLTKWINAKRRGYGKSTVSSPTAKGINGIKGAAEELRSMGLEKLINEKSGTDLDYAREAAIEDGFLPEGATVNDLLAAMDAESRGEPTYSRHDEAEVLDLQAAEAWEKMFDDAGINVFEDSDKELRKKLSGFVSSQNDDAVTPDQAAEKFGFGSGEELLNALANVGNRERHIAEQVRREMQQEFGDPFNDGTLTEKARVLAESEMRARAGEIELEALARAVGEVAASRMAKEMARDTLQMLTVKELSQWRRYLQAERREMQNAMDAVKRGDTVQAFIHKRRQMVNMHLAREGEKLFEQIEKQRKDLQKYETSKNRRDRIAGDYLEKIDDLLAHFELRVSKQGPKEQRRRLSAAEWVAQMDADGKDNLVSDEARLLAELADKKVWRDMTAEEVDLLASTIQNLAHLGRLKDRLLTEQDQRKFSALVSTLVDRMNETGKLPALLGVKGAEVTRVKSPTKTRTEQAVGALREAHSWLMRPEHQARALDGQELGPLWNALFRPMAEAGNVEIRLMREATEKYRAAWSKFSGMERSRMSSVTIAVPELPAIGKRFTRMDMIAIALNWGVQYNREVLMEPYGWTEAQVEAALARTLDDKHWDLVESIWEIAGMYKEEAFALEKAMTGVEPKSVEGMDFTLPNGRVIKGKYYHIEYDGEQPGEASRKQFNDNVAEELSQHRKSRTKAMTKNGGLIARKGSGGRPVKLSLSVFEKGLAETIHDIAFRRAVYDVSRIVSDRSFADAYQEVAGMENYRQLSVWLKDIAKPPAEALDPITRAFAHVRRNIPLAVMGMKVGTALIQPSGILAAMPLVGHRRLAWAVAKAFANPDKSIFGSWQDVAAKSEFMRDRIAGYERDVRETTKAMTKGGPIDFLRRNAFVFINGMDVAVSTPVWIAAYSKAMDGKVKGIEIGSEEDAVAYADSIVRRTQTAGAMQDLSRFQRGGEFQKQISMIFGYFNNLYAISAQETMDMRRGLMPKGQWAWHMTILFVAIPLLAEFMAGRLIPDDDDDDTLAGKAGEAVLLNFVGMFPGIRDAVTYNLKPEFGYNISPTVKGVQDIAGAAGLPFELLLEEDKELTEADVKRVVRAMGAATGIPSSQINITGDYIYDLLQGDENPAEDPAMAAREALVRDTR